MGCASSKESAPQKPKRAILYGSDTNLPTQRYLSDPAPRHVRFTSSTKFEKHRAGKADCAKKMTIKAYPPRRGGSKNEARPKETFEAYARRGLIRQSALLPEDVQSARTARLPQKKRVGGLQK